MSNTIIKSNVLGKRIIGTPGTGISWEVDGIQYMYGYAYVKTNTDNLVDILHAPEGFEILGDIISIKRTHYNGNKKVSYEETVFQPYNGIITDTQGKKWNKENWIKIFGNDDHYYNDVETVTYKDPKTSKIRTDKCHGISIQNEIKVILLRKNRNKPTMSIPIENVLQKNLIK